VQYAEVFFDPQAHAANGIALGTILEGIHMAIGWMGALDITVKMIMCFLRDQDIKQADSLLTELLGNPHSQFVVGVGLDSSEKDHPPDDFKALFKRAQDANLKTTMHCDIDQDDSIGHIKQALHDVHVDRIDHGTNIVEDKSLVDEVVVKKIGFTCCPISNSWVVKDFKGKEIMDLLNKGVKVTINSDDPAFMGGYVTENIKKMLEKGINSRQIIEFQRNAINIAWVSEPDRKKMMTKLDNFLREN